MRDGFPTHYAVRVTETCAGDKAGLRKVAGRHSAIRLSRITREMLRDSETSGRVADPRLARQSPNVPSTVDPWLKQTIGTPSVPRSGQPVLLR